MSENYLKSGEKYISCGHKAHSSRLFSRKHFCVSSACVTSSTNTGNIVLTTPFIPKSPFFFPLSCSLPLTQLSFTIQDPDRTSSLLCSPLPGTNLLLLCESAHTCVCNELDSPETTVILLPASKPEIGKAAMHM